MLGLTIATMVGVPASTALGQIVGWRSAYVIVVVIAAATTLAIWRLVPEPENAGATGSIRGELQALRRIQVWFADRKSTRLNSSHVAISYAVFCLKKKITST